jgi:hypothetical protein
MFQFCIERRGEKPTRNKYHAPTQTVALTGNRLNSRSGYMREKQKAPPRGEPGLVLKIPNCSVVTDVARRCLPGFLLISMGVISAHDKTPFRWQGVYDEMSERITFFDQETRTRLIDYSMEVEDLATPDEVLDSLNDITSEKNSIRVLGANRFSVKVGDWRRLELGRNVFVHRDVPRGWLDEWVAFVIATP